MCETKIKVIWKLHKLPTGILGATLFMKIFKKYVDLAFETKFQYSSDFSLLCSSSLWNSTFINLVFWPFPSLTKAFQKVLNKETYSGHWEKICIFRKKSPPNFATAKFKLGTYCLKITKCFLHWFFYEGNQDWKICWLINN